MYKEEIIGDAKLILGDCLEILPLPMKFDALITDPPFAFAGGLSNGRSSLVDSQFFKTWWGLVCEKLTGTLTQEAEGFIFCDWRTATLIAEGFNQKTQTYDFFRVPQMLYHYREMPGQGQPFRNSVDLIAYMRGPKSKASRIANTTHNWISKYWYYGKHNHHPAEKDPAICEQLIEWSSDERNLVIDPFMGSGTTGIAALNKNRRFVGIEIDPLHFDTACRRIESSQKQAQLII